MSKNSPSPSPDGTDAAGHRVRTRALRCELSSSVTSMSERLIKRIERDFSEQDVAEVIRAVRESSNSERVQAAAVLWARGDLSRLRDSVALIQVDYRDALVRAGLEHEDWPQKLDTELNS